MVTLAGSIVIERPVEEVFAFVADFRNNPRWQPILEVRKLTDGPVGAGTQFLQAFRAMGRRYELVYEITEYEPGRKVGFHYASRPFTTTGAYRFEVVEHGTRVTADGVMQLGGLFRLGEPIFARQLNKQIGTMLSSLKKVLEASSDG